MYKAISNECLSTRTGLIIIHTNDGDDDDNDDDDDDDYDDDNGIN